MELKHESITFKYRLSSGEPHSTQPAQSWFVFPAKVAASSLQAFSVLFTAASRVS